MDRWSPVGRHGRGQHLGTGVVDFPITVVIAPRQLIKKYHLNFSVCLAQPRRLRQTPFILEGVVYGVMGCLIGWVRALSPPHSHSLTSRTTLVIFSPIALPLPLLAPHNLELAYSLASFRRNCRFYGRQSPDAYPNHENFTDRF